jgi:hypothetical protein
MVCRRYWLRGDGQVRRRFQVVDFLCEIFAHRHHHWDFNAARRPTQILKVLLSLRQRYLRGLLGLLRLALRGHNTGRFLVVLYFYQVATLLPCLAQLRQTWRQN